MNNSGILIFALVLRKPESIIAKMNVIFDKAAYEKGRSLQNEVGSDEEGKVIEQIIRDSLATGKVGALTVDPAYLDFEALECEFALIIPT